MHRVSLPAVVFTLALGELALSSGEAGDLVTRLFAADSTRAELWPSLTPAVPSQIPAGSFRTRGLNDSPSRALGVTPHPVSAANTALSPPLWGDVNNDGLVNIIDAQQIARYSVGLSVADTASLLVRGDVTADGLVNIIDAQQIARYTVGLSAAARVGTTQTVVASVTLSAAGESAAFLTSSNFAAALTVQTGSQYLIAVVNTDATSTSLEDFTLSATFGTASAALVLPDSLAPSPRASANVMSGRGPALAPQNRAAQATAAIPLQAQNHLDVLQENREILARYGNPGAAWARSRAQAGRMAPISAAVTQTVGAVNKVYVRKALTGSCNAVDSIGARTVAVGQHVIVLADTNRTAWPQAYRPDSSFYQTFANEFDQITFPHLLTYIGNPLGYDASLSGTGKVTMTITPELNNLGGVPGGGIYAAFVTSCDFYPFVASGPNTFYSNQTEMIYSFVPSASTFSVAGWEAELRATAAHENKHLVSYTDRILLGSAGADEIWLEEGLAQVSSEIWERNFNQATWKGNATFLQTVSCEIDLGPSYPCDLANNRPLALMGGHLPYLFQYLQRESTSNSEGLGVDGAADYGAGWAFSRWVIDQYASSGEGAFIQSLINTTQTGLTNLSSHTGQSIPLLLTYWNLASAVFQTPGYSAADVRTTIPSFNFADIFKVGQSGLPSVSFSFFSANGVPIFPVQPIAFASGTFSKSVTGVPGTSASFFLLTGSTAGVETLQLLSGSGGTLSAGSGFRVAILRVQ